MSDETQAASEVVDGEEADSAHRDAVHDISIDRFNQSFYLSDPADYLRTRLHLLVLTGCCHDQLRSLVGEGVEYAGITLGPDIADQEPDDDSETRSRQRQAFLTVESQMLLHHAAETLLRLFIVHSSQTDVPWIALNSQRNASVFKQMIQEAFVDRLPDPLLVGSVCLGRARWPGDVATQAEWDEGVEGLTLFLSKFARTILDDASLYNGIKHGLGVTPSEASVLIGSTMAGFGTSVEFPESGKWEGEARDWSLTTRWIDIQESLGLVSVAIEMIDSIWQIGRYRKTGQKPKRNGYFPGPLRPAELRSNSGGSMSRMSWRLLREYRGATDDAR